MTSTASMESVGLKRAGILGFSNSLLSSATSSEKNPVNLETLRSESQKLQQREALKNRMLKPAQINSDKEDLTVAKAMQPKGKGWAWKKGHPISFTDEANAAAMLQWATKQPFWHRAADEEAWGPDATYTTVYTDMCLELAEGRCKRSDFAKAMRALVVEAIEEHAKSSDK